MPGDAAARLWDDTVTKKLFELVHSQIGHEKLGGLLGIGS
jgi:FKBP12-rapamycin complex-associated protein